MITIQIITYNSEKNIKSCLDSVIKLTNDCIVADLGSQDNTLNILKSYPVQLIKTINFKRHEVRNDLIKLSKNDLILYLNSWEKLIKLNTSDKNFVIQYDNYKIQEQRIFNKNNKFKFWQYEQLDIDLCKSKTDNLITSKKHEIDINILSKWSEQEPINPYPHYYLYNEYLLNRQYELFEKHALIFSNLKTEINEQTFWTKYYLSWYYGVILKDIKKSFQNLSLLLSLEPTRKELWELAALIWEKQGHIKNKQFFEKASRAASNYSFRRTNKII